MKSNAKNIVLLLLLVAVFIFAAVIVGDMMAVKEEFGYSDVVTLMEEDRIKTFSIDTEGYMTLVAIGENGEEVQHTFRLGYTPQIEYIHDWATEKMKAPEAERTLQTFTFEEPVDQPWIVEFLPYIILMLLMVGLFVYMIRQTSGRGGKMNSFARAHAKQGNQRNTVKFTDVAGADEEKEELAEVVEFLRDPQKYTALGARIPHGILLVGPPGTGKTLLAKAVAGEAGVPFFSISGSDFVEMYVGVGASRVRDLFETARKSPASIVFIDEIDAVGRHRGAGLGGGHDEREQTLNQLLVEMDGFDKAEGIIVIAATNRPDILDPALLRPGRFDRQVTVNYPDIKGREAILRVHAKGKPFDSSVDFAHVARTTVGFTGADLANLLNEAALLAARNGHSLIRQEEIDDAYMKVILGPKKRAKVRTEYDNKLCAYHEAGHAVASYYSEHSAPVKHITIIPSGMAGGVTLRVPEEDRMVTSRREMITDIVVSLGGRVAEQLTLDDVSTGASNDIQKATSVARNMVTRYGMSEKLGTVLYGSEHSSDEVFLGRDFSSGKNYSEKTAAEIDEEIRSIIDGAYAACVKILTDHADKLRFVAEFLLRYEMMDGDQFLAAMERDDATMEDIAAIADQKKRDSDAEDARRKEAEARRRAEEERRREEIARMMGDGAGNGNTPPADGGSTDN